jgi:hypothetical protein
VGPEGLGVWGELVDGEGFEAFEVLFAVHVEGEADGFEELFEGGDLALLVLEAVLGEEMLDVLEIYHFIVVDL